MSSAIRKSWIIHYMPADIRFGSGANQSDISDVGVLRCHAFFFTEEMLRYLSVRVPHRNSDVRHLLGYHLSTVITAVVRCPTDQDSSWFVLDSQFGSGCVAAGFHTATSSSEWLFRIGLSGHRSSRFVVDSGCYCSTADTTHSGVASVVLPTFSTYVGLLPGLWRSTQVTGEKV